MKKPKHKVGDIVRGRTAKGWPIIPMRIDKVVNQCGWREINGKFICPDCVAEMKGE